MKARSNKAPILNTIFARRSIRSFTGEMFPENKLLNILEAAANAPTAGNVQPWKFYVAKERNTREKLAQAAFGQQWMLSAPLIIVVCADLSRSARTYGSRGSELYAIQDTAAAVQNMLLTAVEEGLASCWVGAFREDAAAHILGVNRQELRPVAMIPLGYPAESANRPEKRPLEEIVEYI